MMRAVVFNIHKGYSPLGTKSILKNLKTMLHDLSPDLVLLQEVTGHLDQNHQVDELENQFEFLADQQWPHFRYGKNAITTKGNHGNAILSKYTIIHNENVDLTQHRLEKRGLLYCEMETTEGPLHVMTTHIDLRQINRSKQMQIIYDFIENKNLQGPVIVAGDFNDWNHRVLRFMQVRSFKEALVQYFGRPKATFPALFPVLSLDRFFFKGLEIQKVELVSGRAWGELSDHMAMIVDFSIGEAHE